MLNRISPFFTNLVKESQEGRKLNDGEWSACRAYQRCMDKLRYGEYTDSNIFADNDLPWSSEDQMRQYVEVLRAAGIERLYVTDQSTALMNNLHSLAACGCELEGLAVIPVKDIWGRKVEEKAILVKVN